MAFDYSNSVKKSIVAEGVEGKVILVYGNNNLGKTSQLAKVPGNTFIPFESNALNAIGDAEYLPIYDYATFKDFVESMKNDKEKLEKNKASLIRTEQRLEKLKEDKEADEEDIADLEEKIENLQFKIEKNPFEAFKKAHPVLTTDSITALDKSAEKYITDAADVVDLGDVAHGKLYKRFENEFYHCINDFLQLGFTYLFTAHWDDVHFGEYDEEGEKITKIAPKGTWKRVVKPIIDRSDIIVYLKSNGVDEDGNVIPSSGYLAETDEYFARTKWDNMATVIEEYSYDNLKKVIDDAISEQKKNGVTVGTLEEQQKEIIKKQGLDYKELKKEISGLVKAHIYYSDNEKKQEDPINLAKEEFWEEYQIMVEEILGVGNSASGCTKNQVDHLSLILSKTKEIAARAIEAVEAL